MMLLFSDSKTCIVYDHDGENSLLAKFDHLGNGVVYGPTGDVRYSKVSACNSDFFDN